MAGHLVQVVVLRLFNSAVAIPHFVGEACGIIFVIDSQAVGQSRSGRLSIRHVTTCAQLPGIDQAVENVGSYFQLRGTCLWHFSHE